MRQPDCVMHSRRAALVTAAGGLVSLLAACAGGGPDANRPAFYRNLAQAGGRLDAGNARDMINGYRQSQGIGTVSLNPSLMSLARGYASALANDARFNRNVRPDGKLNARLVSAGYDAAAVQESVTAGYHTFAEAFSGWRDSPPHRRTMLMKNATEMGIAAAYVPNTRYKVYWVLVMARPE